MLAYMVAVAWTLVAVIIAGMAGFFFDARSERRSLAAKIDQTNTRIDQVIMNMATKEDVTELRADIHRVEDKLDEHLHQHGPTPTRQTA